MKFQLNTPLPQPLPKECIKASQIFDSFVDSGNNGLDGVIPRSVLENARGFAIYSVFKAGFLLSARAGSGIVIARLDDGSWSAPSAIGTAGMGVGTQAGAELTDVLIVLNSRTAVVRPTQSVPTILNPNASSQRSFMSAGSVTLGTNLSVAVGPLGRNGEASGSISTGGKITATYSYSKTRGLFGGVSLEGSVIVERQDANCLAYQSDVTAKQLLSGAIPTPEWASGLIKTLESRTGMPGGHKWVQDPDTPTKSTSQYAFGGIPSPSNELSKLRKRSSSSPFSWGKRSTNDSYFSSTDGPTSSPSPTREQPPGHRRSQTHGFATQFQSDYTFDPIKAPPPEESMLIDFDSEEDRLPSNRSDGMQREIAERASTKSDLLTFDSDEEIQPLDASSKPSRSSSLRYRAELSSPLNPKDGVGRAIALFDFVAREAGDLSLKKGDIIVITEKTDRVDDWWTGRVEARTGTFPANFVELA